MTSCLVGSLLWEIFWKLSLVTAPMRAISGVFRAILRPNFFLN